MGEQTAEAEWASVKAMPWAARRSRFGVLILPSGYRGDVAVAEVVGEDEDDVRLVRGGRGHGHGGQQQ